VSQWVISKVGGRQLQVFSTASVYNRHTVHRFATPPILLCCTLLAEIVFLFEAVIVISGHEGGQAALVGTVQVSYLENPVPVAHTLT
jgi:hypothetical protein